MVVPLAVVLITIGTARALEVEITPDWGETAVLWMAVLAEPGERKTALLNLLAAPVHAWQADEHELLRLSLSSYNERRRCLESRISALQREMQKKPKAGVDPAKLESQAIELRAKLLRVFETGFAEMAKSWRGFLTRRVRRTCLVLDTPKMAGMTSTCLVNPSREVRILCSGLVASVTSYTGQR
jgi:hypothetical protein